MECPYQKNTICPDKLPDCNHCAIKEYYAGVYVNPLDKTKLRKHIASIVNDLPLDNPSFICHTIDDIIQVLESNYILINRH